MSLQAHAPAGMRGFSVERPTDIGGVSGTGVVLEGVVFSTGQTVVHWLTPAPSGNIAIWPSFNSFMEIHIACHPENQTRIVWEDGDVWEPGHYNVNSSPYRQNAGIGAPQV